MTYGVYIFFASMLILASGMFIFAGFQVSSLKLEQVLILCTLTVYAYFFIHETKSLRIDQMDKLFGYERKAHSVYDDGRASTLETRRDEHKFDHTVEKA